MRLCAWHQLPLILRPHSRCLSFNIAFSARDEHFIAVQARPIIPVWWTREWATFCYCTLFSLSKESRISFIHFMVFFTFTHTRYKLTRFELLIALLRQIDSDSSFTIESRHFQSVGGRGRDDTPTCASVDTFSSLSLSESRWVFYQRMTSLLFLLCMNLRQKRKKMHKY